MKICGVLLLSFDKRKYVNRSLRLYNRDKWSLNFCLPYVSYTQPCFPFACAFVRVCETTCVSPSSSCAYVASNIRIVGGLWSGMLHLNGVNMTLVTSISTPAECSVSHSTPAALFPISLDLLHVVSPHLSLFSLCFTYILALSFS